MKRQNHIGEMGMFFFKNDLTGEVIMEKRSVQEYDDCFIHKTQENSIPDGHSFLQASREMEFDTESGYLEPDQYAVSQDKVYFNEKNEVKNLSPEQFTKLTKIKV